MRVSSMALVCALSLSACGGGGGAADNPPAPPAEAARWQLLFFGNSHTQQNDIPNLIAAMVEQQPGGRAVATVAPGLLFLDERLSDAASTSLMSSRTWTHVFLQAQRYSSSGSVDYSTREAEQWVQQTRTKPALPILFPEWPRRGIDETARIYALHKGIGERAGACVAPVPQAFDLARRVAPDLVLHAADGNHSSAEGALLAAYVLYASASNLSPAGLGYLTNSPVASGVQLRLRQIAADSLSAGPSVRLHCPNL